MSAQLEEHNYGGYRPKTFYIVVCRECLVALNSGHHYTEDVKHFAQELADEHNRLNHEGEGDLVTDPAEIEQIKARLQYTAGEFEDYSDEFEASR